MIGYARFLYAPSGDDRLRRVCSAIRKTAAGGAHFCATQAISALENSYLQFASRRFRLRDVDGPIG